MSESTIQNAIKDLNTKIRNDSIFYENDTILTHYMCGTLDDPYQFRKSFVDIKKTKINDIIKCLTENANDKKVAEIQLHNAVLATFMKYFARTHTYLYFANSEAVEHYKSISKSEKKPRFYELEFNIVTEAKPANINTKLFSVDNSQILLYHPDDPKLYLDYHKAEEIIQNDIAEILVGNNSSIEFLKYLYLKSCIEHSFSQDSFDVATNILEMQSNFLKRLLKANPENPSNPFISVDELWRDLFSRYRSIVLSNFINIHNLEKEVKSNVESEVESLNSNNTDKSLRFDPTSKKDYSFAIEEFTRRKLLERMNKWWYRIWTWQSALLYSKLTADEPPEALNNSQVDVNHSKPVCAAYGVVSQNVNRICSIWVVSIQNPLVSSSAPETSDSTSDHINNDASLDRKEASQEVPSGLKKLARHLLDASAELDKTAPHMRTSSYCWRADASTRLDISKDHLIDLEKYLSGFNNSPDLMLRNIIIYVYWTLFIACELREAKHEGSRCRFIC